VKPPREIAAAFFSHTRHQDQGTRSRGVKLLPGRAQGDELMRLRSQIKSTSTKQIALALAAVAGIVPGASAAFADAYQLDYQVHHSKYGNVGSYTNVVDTQGPNTTVTTKLNIKVSFLGISAYHQTAQRVERWQGDRLVYLHSLTTTNGKPVEVDGVAKGDHFQVTSPNGSEQAPATVRVADPWSPKLMNGEMIITADDGAVANMQISPAQDTMVDVAGMQVPAKEYDIDLIGQNEKYQVWFDNTGTAVKFDKIDKDGTVTFTLNSKTPVNPLVAAAGTPGAPP
jgi:hypothetical protein